jgi:uncharacterized protein (DUF1697 family)
MPLVAFLRGVNVGGHRTFRPSVLANQLAEFGVVNIGAAGTFVVRKPGSRTAFRSALLAELPFEAELMLCDAKDLLRIHRENPFGEKPPRSDVVRFVSVLSKASRIAASIPLQLPATGQWLVRVVGSQHPFAFGEYRRHMKTVGYLGQMDKMFGVPVTTRNWNTIDAIAKVLNARTSE